MSLTRVLHITEQLQSAGIESFIMNLYRNIDRTRVQFDFLVLRNEHEFYEDEILHLGGKKFFIESKRKNTLLRVYDECRLLRAFLKEHHYDIVHIHYTTPLRAPYLKILKEMGVSTRIYHSHSAYVAGKGLVKNVVYAYMRQKLAKYATHYFACSKVAAEWCFPKNKIGSVKIVFNGIDTNKFAFNEQLRKETRQELGVDEKKVVVHTGRFLEQKNHAFIIDVFNFLKKIDSDVFLLLLGVGPLQNEIKAKVQKLGLEKDVLFLNVKPDVYRYLDAADCYIMPSLYEGLPVAAIEAQCSGLPSVLSRNITPEVALIDRIKFVDLNSPIEEWTTVIEDFLSTKRVDGSEMVQRGGYDMKIVAKDMADFYCQK